MKIPLKVVFVDNVTRQEVGLERENVETYCYLPNGFIIVLVRTGEGPEDFESYWFNAKGINPKSYLVFVSD